MPSSPVFCYTLWKEWSSEILRKSNTKHLCNTNCNIYTTCEICIQINCVQQHSYKCICTIIHRNIRLYCGKSNGCPVCDYHLLKISPQNSLKTILYINPRESMTFKQAFLQIIPSAYRSLYKLWEKGHKQCISERILLCICNTAIHINHISGRLECIKWYSHRKYKINRIKCCKCDYKHIGVFKYSKYSKINKQNNSKKHFLFS